MLYAILFGWHSWDGIYLPQITREIRSCSFLIEQCLSLLAACFYFATVIGNAVSKNPFHSPQNCCRKKLVIKDTKGKIVVGASVEEYAIRSLESPGSPFWMAKWQCGTGPISDLG